MLRDREEKAPARTQRLVDLCEDALVLLDVLEDVERSGDVELRAEWDLARIHLQQVGIRHPPASDVESGREQLAADEAHLWEGAPNSREDIPGAAAHLEHAARVGKVLAECPEDQLVAGAEPEAPPLCIRQVLERFLVEAARRCGTAHVSTATPTPVAP